VIAFAFVSLWALLLLCSVLTSLVIRLIAGQGTEISIPPHHGPYSPYSPPYDYHLGDMPPAVKHPPATGRLFLFGICIVRWPLSLPARALGSPYCLVRTYITDGTRDVSLPIDRLYLPDLLHLSLSLSPFIFPTLPSLHLPTPQLLISSCRLLCSASHPSPLIKNLSHPLPPSYIINTSPPQLAHRCSIDSFT
jgi:hypothetical protein